MTLPSNIILIESQGMAPRAERSISVIRGGVETQWSSSNNRKQTGQSVSYFTTRRLLHRCVASSSATCDLFDFFEDPFGSPNGSDDALEDPALSHNGTFGFHEDPTTRPMDAHNFR